VEADLWPADLQRATEIFISSSTRDVQPVHRIDQRTLSAVGDITTAVSSVFRARSAAEGDPLN
jgi:branched-chain amino acid aminotransferase